jgi:hypothetical protein
MNAILQEVRGEIVVSYQTAMNPAVKMTVIAEGPWSAVDIERLHTLLDKSLRIGAFDATIPNEKAKDHP